MSATGNQPERGADLELAFRLPVPGWPRAVFRSNFSYDGGRLFIADKVVLEARDRDELERGVRGRLPGRAAPVSMRLVDPEQMPRLRVIANGRDAPKESELRAPTSRSAWIHAWIALFASFAGFVASYLYLLKAETLDSAWALKMGNHMAGWHLLLTFTLFPASVWGQRLGIRSVQFVSFVFFAIHAGIAIANTGPSDPLNPDDPGIALLNGISGLLILVATVYGNRAHRDMDPLPALRATPPGESPPDGAD